MRKTAQSLFTLLAVFSIIAITPSAFADHVAATVTNAPGSSIPGCEETADGCFIPSTVTIDVGGEVIWENADTMSHTITSGTAAEGLDGHFDSSLVMSGSTFSHTFNEAGTFDYFCMVHPWMVGSVVVSGEEKHMEEKHMEGMEQSEEKHMEGMEQSEEKHMEGMEQSGMTDLSDQLTATVTSGVIHHIGGNTDDATLTVHLFSADDDGELKITLNSDIITPFDDGSYFVLVNSEETDFEQMGNTLHIPYEAGTEKIEIVGSYAVPEFGTIAMIVLAVAVVSIIAITAKTKTALIPKL
jgi:predicted secreted protein with PEFG-CTERM motif